ncbi:hypothetical protein K431DRAFT_197 [Polychaeton citri CBS 116435]|uniref:Uncharacterized protein n=1 Tax=Polychaeton citri CBS 116435 TaxID=1314669 RepID=A0A9P4QEZ2_9PEZI|nr:hypothetical protein K431DRAFT_197 [Polychaeton citri CBS 116435]
MPYTKLQIIDWLVHCRKPHLIYPRSLNHHLHTTKYPQRCRLRACRAKNVRRKRKLVIFKVTGPGRSMNWYYENQPCGMLGCGVCGLMLSLGVSDLEKEAPGLVEEIKRNVKLPLQRATISKWTGQISLDGH